MSTASTRRSSHRRFALKISHRAHEGNASRTNAICAEQIQGGDNPQLIFCYAPTARCAGRAVVPGVMRRHADSKRGRAWGRRWTPAATPAARNGEGCWAGRDEFRAGCSGLVLATAIVAPISVAANVTASTGIAKTGDATRVTNPMAAMNFFISYLFSTTGAAF